MKDYSQILMNPLFAAGLKGNGNPIGQALLDSSQVQRQNELAESEIQKNQFEIQEKQREAMLAKSLPQVLKEIDWNNPQEAQAKLAGAGLKPQEIHTLFGVHKGIQDVDYNKNKLSHEMNVDNQTLGLRREELGQRRAEHSQEKAIKPTFFEGADKQQYEVFVNPETGQREARMLPGQGGELGVQPRKITAAEIRLNKTNLDKLNGVAKSSSEQLKQLTALEKAYEQFDKEATGSIGAGSYTSSLLPQSDEHEGFGKKVKQGIENTLYSDKARNALHTIKKVNSLLLQNRISAQKGNGPVTDILKKEIKQGLPNPEILPEARKENIKSLKREAFKNIIEQQFVSTWSKVNNRDTDEAGAAFNSFIDSIPIVDENGNPNKEALKLIPIFVKEFLGTPSQSQIMPSGDEGFEQYNYNFE